MCPFASSNLLHRSDTLPPIAACDQFVLVAVAALQPSSLLADLVADNIKALGKKTKPRALAATLHFLAQAGFILEIQRIEMGHKRWIDVNKLLENLLQVLPSPVQVLTRERMNLLSNLSGRIFEAGRKQPSKGNQMFKQTFCLCGSLFAYLLHV